MIEKDIEKSSSYDSVCDVILYTILILTSDPDRIFALSKLGSIETPTQKKFSVDGW